MTTLAPYVTKCVVLKGTSKLLFVC